MELNKETMKKIRSLILFTALLVVVFVNYRAAFGVIKVGFNIIFPFVLGGAMAFIINAPLQFFERHLFKNNKLKNNKIAQRVARPVSLLISLLAVVAVIVLVVFVVVPELAKTFISLGNTISDFVPTVQKWVENLFQGSPIILEWSKNLELDWDNIASTVVDFLRSGASNVLSSTYSIAKSVVSGLTTFFIGFVFACYIVLQKERLSVQIKKVLYALMKKNAVDQIMKVCSISYRTFLNFISGQCMEAVILGTMFFIVMSLFRFPYAMLVGILIAFTALIPIFGAFIGCFVGAFLILMVNPVKAIAFVIVFLVLQQLEGNFIYPHVVGNSVGLPSIWVLVAVTLGANLMGVVGMLIFIPVTSVIYSLFREYVYKRLKEKRIRVDTL